MTRKFLVIILFCLSTRAITNLNVWCRNGQIWLVWEEMGADPFAYDVYFSHTPITNILQADFAGSIFPDECKAYRLKETYNPSITWTIPGKTNNNYRLSPSERLFVFTPHIETNYYFAVVEYNDTNITSGSTTGPIKSVFQPIQCYVQAAGILTSGYPFTIYAFFVDGRSDYNSGLTNYPVMANEYGNGVGQLFALYEPVGGAPAGDVPTIFALHGWGGNYSNWEPPLANHDIDLQITNSYIAAADDAVLMFRGASLGVDVQYTWWFGYWEKWNRFIPVPAGTLPPDDAIIVDYTFRKIKFMQDWLIENKNADPEKQAIIGGSMGGSGAIIISKSFADSFAAATSFCPPVNEGPDSNTYMACYFGSYDQNLTTSLGYVVADVYNPDMETTTSGVDMPITRLVHGTEDTNIGWLDKQETYRQLDASRRGHHIYWDERTHSDWGGCHWTGSERFTAEYLTRYRVNQSFPAVSNEKPRKDPGDGTTGSYDPWGTWGGYFDWNTDNILDETNLWEATMFLVSASSFGNDVPDFDSYIADISIRRPQKFLPAADEELNWSLVRLNDSQIMDSGEFIVLSNNLVTVTNLTLYKEPCRLSISSTPIPEPCFTYLVNAGALFLIFVNLFYRRIR